MYPSSSQLHLYNRRLLLHSPPPPSPTTTQSDVTSLDSTYAPTSNGFNANVIMVLSVLLCALFCSLGLNSLIRCTIRCSAFVGRNPTEEDDDRRAALEKVVGGGGVNKKALKTFPTVSFSAEVGKVSGLDTECVICLSEFVAGEKVRLLPKCNHGFHVRCIDRWLGSHSSCPTCRCCLVVGQLAASSSAQPLQREDMIHT